MNNYQNLDNMNNKTYVSIATIMSFVLMSYVYCIYSQLYCKQPPLVQDKVVAYKKKSIK